MIITIRKVLKAVVMIIKILIVIAITNKIIEI